MIRWLLALILFAISAAFAAESPPARAQEPSPVGIIVAMKEHERALLERLKARQTRTLAARNFHRGTLAGQPVVLVRSPMGKIGVATTASWLIARYAPAALISVAPAGALGGRPATGTLLFASAVVEYDTGSWVDAGYRWPKLERLPVDGHLLDVARQAAQASSFAHEIGIVASGDAFIASAAKAREIATRTEGIAVEPSSAAVARVGAWAGTPVLLLRFITDHADAGAGLSFDEEAHDMETTERIVAVLEEVLRRWRR